MIEDRLGVSRQILAVEFSADMVAITYFTVPEDLRKTGLQQSHRLVIPLDTNEYADELEAAQQIIQALLNDAIEDLRNLPPFNPNDNSDDDEDDEDDEDDG